ncbi:MAG: DUF4150 domain-containing protein [Polyangiaceae bacterium]
MCTTQGPTDTCKTPAPPAPPVPTPYPNIAMCNQANPGTCTKKVKINNQPALTKDTQIPMSSGDEAGAAGGVVSGMIKGPCAYKKFSAKVKFEGANAVHATCNTGQNGSSPNTVGLQAQPSQTKVMIS